MSRRREKARRLISNGLPLALLRNSQLERPPTGGRLNVDASRK